MHAVDDADGEPKALRAADGTLSLELCSRLAECIVSLIEHENLPEIDLDASGAPKSITIKCRRTQTLVDAGFVEIGDGKMQAIGVSARTAYAVVNGVRRAFSLPFHTTIAFNRFDRAAARFPGAKMFVNSLQRTLALQQFYALHDLDLLRGVLLKDRGKLPKKWEDLLPGINDAIASNDLGTILVFLYDYSVHVDTMTVCNTTSGGAMASFYLVKGDRTSIVKPMADLVRLFQKLVRLQRDGL